MAVSGVGSGLDVNSLVTQLVAAERAPTDQRLGKQESATRAQITAFGALRSALSGLQGALSKLDGTGAAMGRKATVGTDAGFGASAGATAALGTHRVSVERLASTHKLQSPATGASTQLGYGSLSITAGNGSPIVVDIASGKGTLADIRDAINAKAQGKGVTATLVHGDGGDVLTLTATTSGTAGTLSIEASGGDGGLASLGTSGGSLVVASPAQDGLVKIDGVTRTASSNTLSDALDGVTLTLTKADPGKEFNLTVGADPAALKGNLQSLVGAYNAAVGAMRAQSTAGGEGKAAGALSGDSLPRNALSSLRAAMAQSYGELSALGIKSNVDGLLSLDTAKFDTTVAADPQAVSRVLGTDGALGKALRGQMESLVGKSGQIGDRTEALNGRMKQITRQKERLQVHMDSVEATYRKQFTALDGLMSKMQSMSNYLTQQFASL